MGHEFVSPFAFEMPPQDPEIGFLPNITPIPIKPKIKNINNATITAVDTIDYSPISLRSNLNSSVIFIKNSSFLRIIK